MGVDPVGSVVGPHRQHRHICRRGSLQWRGWGTTRSPGRWTWGRWNDCHRHRAIRGLPDGANRLTREEGLFGGRSAGFIVQLPLGAGQEIDDPERLPGGHPRDWSRALPLQAVDRGVDAENGFLSGGSRSVHDLLGPRTGTGAAGVLSVNPSTPCSMALVHLTTHEILPASVLLDGSACSLSEGI